LSIVLNHWFCIARGKITSDVNRIWEPSMDNTWGWEYVWTVYGRKDPTLFIIRLFGTWCWVHLAAEKDRSLTIFYRQNDTRLVQLRVA
jgi:hypothetical protein